MWVNRWQARVLYHAGETEEQFQRTVTLVREVGFDRVNTAAYSPRPNTPAAVLEDQVGALYNHKHMGNGACLAAL